jgi:hypothetical protein
MDTASSKHGRKKEVTKNFGKENWSKETTSKTRA